MGFFDFLKPKKNVFNNAIAQMHAKIFPKGEKDMNAVADELLYILNYKITKDEARSIGVKSVAISRLSENFSKDRLKQHLAGYCLHHFDDNQIETFHGYLSFLAIADAMFRKTPSEIIRKGDTWVIPE